MKVKLNDVIDRITGNVDRYNTELEYYVGGEHYECGRLAMYDKGLLDSEKGSTLGFKFHFPFQATDVLFMARNPHLKKAAMVMFDGICSDASYILRTKDESILQQRYIPLIIQNDNFWAFFEANKSGSVNYLMNWKEMKEYEFDLPDIKKQEELVELVWGIEETIAAYERLLAKTDELVKSQFIEMFYGKGYPVKTIGDVIDKKIVRAGKAFEKTDSIQYLDISSIDNTSKTVTGLTPYVLADAPSRAQYVLKQNDIMYSTVRPNLQNIAINPYADDNVVGSTGFCVLRCIGVTTGYMWGVINSIPFTEAMVNQASGANYPAVTDKVVHAYEIPIPPESEQNAYEELVRQSDKSKFELRKAIENLKQMQRTIIKENV